MAAREQVKAFLRSEGLPDGTQVADVQLQQVKEYRQEAAHDTYPD